MIGKYAQLKAASNILDFKLEDFAASLGTSLHVVRQVCYGGATSARISKAVDQKIEEANKVWCEYWQQKRAAEYRIKGDK